MSATVGNETRGQGLNEESLRVQGIREQRMLLSLATPAVEASPPAFSVKLLAATRMSVCYSEIGTRTPGTGSRVLLHHPLVLQNNAEHVCPCVAGVPAEPVPVDYDRVPYSN